MASNVTNSIVRLFDGYSFPLNENGEYYCDCGSCAFKTQSKRKWIIHQKVSHPERFTVFVDTLLLEKQAVDDAIALIGDDDHVDVDQEVGFVQIEEQENDQISSIEAVSNNMAEKQHTKESIRQDIIELIDQFFKGHVSFPNYMARLHDLNTQLEHLVKSQ